jgi:CSLREA domain-containing protein
MRSAPVFKLPSNSVRTLARTVPFLLLVLLGVFMVKSRRVKAGVTDPGGLTYLADAQRLPSTYTGDPALTSALNSGQAQPLAITTADLDQDGTDDAIVGYGLSSGSGILALHPGNREALAPSTQASWNAIAQGQFPAPLSTNVGVISIPQKPDFVAAGRLVGSDHADVITATKNSNFIYMFPGNGHLQLGPPSTLSVSGGVTALAAGRFGSQMRYNSLLVATGGTSPSLLVYAGSRTGLTLATSFALPAAATGISLGDLDGDLLPDALLVCGNQLVVVHGSLSVTTRVETLSLPVSAQSAIVGSFIHDRAWRQQIAVLGTDGSISIAAHGGFNPAAWSKQEIQAMWQAKTHRAPNPYTRPTTPTLDGWRIVESFPAVAPFTSHPPLLYVARVSAQGAQDIMVVDGDTSMIGMISHPNVKPGATTFVSGKLVTKPYMAGIPVAGIPSHVNIDARDGMLMLHQSQVGISAMMPLPDPTFVVNTTNDTVDANPGDGICADAAGQCSLRAAVMEANANMNGADPTNPANTQDTILLPAGTFRLTIPPGSTFDASTGHLDINDSVNIVGAGPRSTIIQAANGDQAFSILDLTPANAPDPGLQGPGITVSIASLTISGGQATAAEFFNLGGGAIAWDAGTDGTGTLNLNSVVLSGNSSTAAGGALAVSDFGLNPDSGVTISNSVISNNTALIAGGGISTNGTLSLTLSNSQIVNNQAIDSNPGDGSPEQGGGLFLFSPSPASSFIHASTISGNTAGSAGLGQGGGVWTMQAMVIDQGSVISNNQAGADGGGVWAGLINSTDSVNVFASTISGNTAVGNGGGIQVDSSNTGNFTVLLSRIVGNSSGVGGDGLNNASTAPVVADDNWWGCNVGPAIPTSPCDHVQGVTPASLVTLSLGTNPATLLSGGSSQLTAAFQNGNTIFAQNLNSFTAVPASFLNATGGLLSNAQTITGPNAAATAIFTAGSAGAGSVQVTVDQQTLTTALTLQDYSVSIAPAQQSVTAGTASSVNYTGTVTGQNGFSGTVNLSCNAAPAGSGVTVSCPASVAVTSGQSATFTITVSSAANATPSVYQTSVNASNGGQARSASASFSVADFTLSAAQPSLTTNSGVSGSLTDALTLNSAGGLSGAVSISCSAPVGSGITASCSPTSLTLPANTPRPALLTVNVPSTVAPGSYPISVTASAPGASRSLTVNVVVANFTVAVTPVTQSINAGSNATYTVTASSNNGFNFSQLPVTLTCTVPTGAGFNANCPSGLTVNPNGTASASVTVSSSNTSSSTSNLSFKVSAGATSATTTVALTVANFSVTSSVSSQTINSGTVGSSTYVLTLSSQGGFSGTVTLNCAAPTGSPISGSCSPASVVIPAGGSATSTLTLSSPATAAAGSYAIPITAGGSGISQTSTATLVVADFALAASPSSITAIAGAVSQPVTISGTTTSGFNGTVSFSPSDVAGLPAGAVPSFSNASITVASGSSTNITGLSVSLPANAAPGTYPLTITGRSGSAARTVSVSLAVGGFTLTTAAPGSSITITAGATATFNLSLQSLSGFAGTVNAAAAVTASTGTSTAKPTVNVSPSSVALTIGSQGTFAVVVPTSIFDSPATYTITVTATGGAIVETTTLTLVENPPPPTLTGFALNPNQTAFGAITFQAFLEGVGGFNAPLTITTSVVSGPTLPQGVLFGFCVTCALSPPPPGPPQYVTTIQGTMSPISPGAPPSAIIDFTLSPAAPPGPSVPPGTYVVRLTATGGGQTQQLDFTVNYVLPESFTMITNPGVGTDTVISQGQTATYTVTLSNFQNIPAGTVITLSDPTLTQAGALVSFSPPTLSAPGTSTMTVTTTGDTQTGTSEANIIASDGTPQLTQGVELFLTVNPSPVASITPASQTIQPGASASYTVTPLAFNGCFFVTGIGVTVTGLPPSSTLSGGPGTAWGSTVVTVTSASTTPQDTYTLTVSGNNCGHTFSIPATLTVSAPTKPPVGGGGCTAGGRPINCQL